MSSGYATWSDVEAGGRAADRRTGEEQSAGQRARIRRHLGQLRASPRRHREQTRIDAQEIGQSALRGGQRPQPGRHPRRAWHPQAQAAGPDDRQDQVETGQGDRPYGRTAQVASLVAGEGGGGQQRESPGEGGGERVGRRRTATSMKASGTASRISQASVASSHADDAHVDAARSATPSHTGI